MMSLLCGCLMATLTLSLTGMASQLLAPRNIQLTSNNMNLYLRWSPPENESREVLYWTQLWGGFWSEPRAACVNTTALHCELSDPGLGIKLLEFGTYNASVRAQCGAQRSQWVNSSKITMDKDTVIGPPGVELDSHIEDLEVIVTEPKFHIASINIYGTIQYNISWWPRGHYHRVKHELLQQNRAVLSELEPGTEYCVQVRVRVEPGMNHHPPEASQPLCGTTKNKSSAPWLAAVLTFFALALVVAVVVTTVVYRGRIRHFLCPKEPLPQHLPECPGSLSYLTPEVEVYHPLSVLPLEDSPSTEALRS